MGQTMRLTQLTALTAEEAHDRFEEVIADRRIEATEVEAMRLVLDATLVSASKADVATQIGVCAIRGAIGTKYHRELVADFNRLAMLANAFPELPDAA